MLMAPKRAEQKRKLEAEKIGNKKKKQKVYGMELSFPTDHPEVPKMIETIVKLYSVLQKPTDVRSQRSNMGTVKDEQS